MARYLLIYRADPAIRATLTQPSADQAAAMNAAWTAWASSVGDGLVDFGAPSIPISAGADPWVGGYSIVEAEDRAAVMSLLATHPHRAAGGTIDIHELSPIPST